MPDILYLLFKVLLYNQMIRNIWTTKSTFNLLVESVPFVCYTNRFCRYIHPPRYRIRYAPWCVPDNQAVHYPWVPYIPSTTFLLPAYHQLRKIVSIYHIQLWCFCIPIQHRTFQSGCQSKVPVLMYWSIIQVSP